MKPRSNFSLLTASSILTIGTAFLSSNAQAYDLSSQARGMSFGLEYVDTWGSSCGCNANNLSYTSNQMYYLDRVLRSYGASRSFYYSNKNANPNDLIEDGGYGGNDHLYGDNVSLYAYSGHGNLSGDVYSIVMCSTPTNSNCYFSSNKAVWGETSSYTPNSSVLPTQYKNKGSITRHLGNLRWAILATCFSVDGNPYRVWKSAGTSTSFEFLMGYKGLSADSATTDEVPEDWAENVYENGMTFKAGWFSAAEDWWENDTAGVAAFDNTDSEASDRINYQTVTYRKRTPGYYSQLHVYWSWHEG